jgi:predicted phage terminase large subunit-like protein
MSSNELFEEYQLLQELHRRQAQESLSKFITYCKDDYSLQWFHKLICDKLDALLDGSLGKDKLMIFVPPQHGKSEISSRQFPAYALGKNPKTKIALCSYSSDLASGFNRSVQQIIDTDEYNGIFPDTQLNSTNVSSDSKRGVLRNSTIFETVGYLGFLKAVGVGGSLTGTPVDLGIIDDPFKDRQEARSKTIREKVWSWYEDVFSTRLHNSSKQLLLFTRWHEDDLAGRLLHREADQWEVVAIPALKEEMPPLPQAIEINDPRGIDEALWADKHSAERIKKIREFSPITFSSLYQQRPTAQEGNLIKREWFEIVSNWDNRKFKTDIYIDGAYTSNTANDPTAIMLVAYNKEQSIVLNSTTVHLELYELLEFFPKYCDTHNVEKGRTRVFIEPKASGKSLRSMLKKKGYNAIEINNKRVALGKVSRVEDSSPALQAGKVSVLKGSWNNNFIDECVSFPNGLHDDQVDNLCYSVFEYFISPPKFGLKQIN